MKNAREDCIASAAIAWLADRLAGARILVGHDACTACPAMGRETCASCWRDAALTAAVAQEALDRQFEAQTNEARGR